MSHVASILQARATDRRRLLTEYEARTAIAWAPLSEVAEKSRMANALRVRCATRILVERGRHPEQIIPAMGMVATDIIGSELIATEAVAVHRRGDRLVHPGADLLDEVRGHPHPLRRPTNPGGGDRRSPVDRCYARLAGLRTRHSALHQQPGEAVRQEPAS